MITTQLPTWWKEILAEDFCIKVADWTHDSPKQSQEWKYLVTSKNLKNGWLDLSSSYKISLEDFNEVNKRSKVDKWDILLWMIWTVWEVCLISEDPDFAIKNVWLFKCWNEIQAKYLYYYLKSHLWQNYILSRLSWTTQKYITLWELRKFPIITPSDPQEQEAIAWVLSAFDDKIELLRSQNKTLEQLGQTIFQERFGRYSVDDPENLPEGWKVGKLGEIINFIIDNRGKTPPIIENSNNSVPLVEVNAIVWSNRIIDINQCKKFVDQETYNSWFRKGHPQNGDVLISTVGSIGQLAQVFDEKICIAQNIVALRFPTYSNFLYQLLNNIQSEIISIDISSVQPSIKVPHLLNIEIIIPSKQVIEEFEKKISPFTKKISYNNSQIQSLSSSRDALLPKLMNGEVRVEF